MITLNEDLFEDLEVDSADNILAAPKDSKDTYIAEHLMNLIKDEYEAIQGYNKFLDNIGTHEEMKSTIEDIAMEEMKHVGQLQALLKTISPNVEAVETGTKEAEEMLDKEVEADAPIDESLNESLDKFDKEAVLDWAKDDFENGQIIDPDDYSEFAKICEESAIKPSKELFDLYFEEIDNLRDEEDEDLLNESLEVDNDGYKFEVVKSAYRNNNLPFLALAIKDSEDKDEIGQFWSDITINLDGLEVVNEDAGLVIALDNDFDQFAPADLKEKVLDALTTNEIITTIPSGFVDFKVYKLKDNILDSIRTIDDFEDEIENQEKE